MALDNFGIDAVHVYANDSSANPAFWTVFPGGTHGKIVTALVADPMVSAAIHAKLSAPNDPNARAHVVDTVNRQTAACIGQLIVRKHINPADQSVTLYHILSGGTAADLDAIISAPVNADLHAAFAAKDTNKIIEVISRQTGRGLFQASQKSFTSLLSNPMNALSELEKQLKNSLPAI